MATLCTLYSKASNDRSQMAMDGGDLVVEVFREVMLSPRKTCCIYIVLFAERFGAVVHHLGTSSFVLQVPEDISC
jgi:hypothetical protein